MGIRDVRRPVTVSALVRHAARHDTGFVAVVAGGAMLTSAPVVFMWTYMLNDAIDGDDHISFVTTVGAVVAAVCLVAGVLVRLSSRLPWREALAGSVLVGVAVLCASGAAYAGLNLLPALDNAVGYSAGGWQCVGWMSGLALVAAAAALGGHRLLTTST